MSFAPVADYSASYYDKSVNDINWLSIVYLLCYLLFGLVAVWILDVLGLRTGVGFISDKKILHSMSALEDIFIISRKTN